MNGELVVNQQRRESKCNRRRKRWTRERDADCLGIVYDGMKKLQLLQVFKCRHAMLRYCAKSIQYTGQFVMVNEQSGRWSPVRGVGPIY